MIKRHLFFSIMILFFYSCSKETGSSLLYFKTFQLKQETKSTIEEEKFKIDTLFLFTGDNVKWYNAKTKEIKFKNASLMDYIPCLFVFLDEKELFILRVVPTIMSYTLDNPVLIYDTSQKRYFFGKGYPDWDWGEFIEEREKNWKEIEPGWNLFVEQLKKEGRYRN